MQFLPKSAIGQQSWDPLLLFIPSEWIVGISGSEPVSKLLRWTLQKVNFALLLRLSHAKAGLGKIAEYTPLPLQTPNPSERRGDVFWRFWRTNVALHQPWQQPQDQHPASA